MKSINVKIINTFVMDLVKRFKLVQILPLGNTGSAAPLELIKCLIIETWNVMYIYVEDTKINVMQCKYQHNKDICCFRFQRRSY